MRPVKKKDDADYTVKIVIVGDSGVGKTNILFRFCNNQFKTNYVATIGVDFKNKIIQVGDTKVKLQIWDTAGQERFKNINSTYFKGAMGVILVYAIDNPNSFQNLDNWIKQINEHSQSNIIKFLVANKCDLNTDRKITYDQGIKMANKYQMDFIEVSAKDGSNVNVLFNKLGERVYDYLLKTENPNEEKDKRISLHKKQDQVDPESRCKC